jgi:hypothetical protein
MNAPAAVFNFKAKRRSSGFGGGLWQLERKHTFADDQPFEAFAFAPGALVFQVSGFKVYVSMSDSLGRVATYMMYFAWGNTESIPVVTVQ